MLLSLAGMLEETVAAVPSRLSVKPVKVLSCFSVCSEILACRASAGMSLCSVALVLLSLCHMPKRFQEHAQNLACTGVLHGKEWRQRWQEMDECTPEDP